MKPEMKHFLAIVALMLASTPLAAQRYVTDSVRVNGHYRAFTLYLPAGLPAGAPLVWCMHGYRKTVAKPSYFDLDAVADREKFAVCYPAGIYDSSGHYGFNVHYPKQASLTNDEVSDQCKLARWVQKRYRLSTVNTFATGMSNGGDICYLLAYRGQDVFSALAPVSGITMAWIYEGYQAPKPVPIYEIHGTADKTSRWDGDMANKGGWGAYLPLKLSMAYWIARDRCTVVEKPDTIAGKNPANGHYVVRHRFTGGTDGCQVWVDEVVGATHSWHSRDMDTGEAIWAFFKQYLK